MWQMANVVSLRYKREQNLFIRRLQRMRTSSITIIFFLQSLARCSSLLECPPYNVTRSEYLPGTPGGSWSQEDLLVVRAKLWRLYSNRFGIETWWKEGKIPNDLPEPDFFPDLGFFPAKVVRLRWSCKSPLDSSGSHYTSVSTTVSAMLMGAADVTAALTGPGWAPGSTWTASNTSSRRTTCTRRTTTDWNTPWRCLRSCTPTLTSLPELRSYPSH